MKKQLIYIMNIRFRFTVILFILLSAISGRTGDLLSHSIESHLSKYRHTINKRDILVINGIIRLEITARRLKNTNDSSIRVGIKIISGQT